MSAVTPPPHWPTDPDHREAIQALLLMAEAEDRWGEPRRAGRLLDNVEEIIGELPQAYARMRTRCRGVSVPLIDGP